MCLQESELWWLHVYCNRILRFGSDKNERFNNDVLLSLGIIAMAASRACLGHCRGATWVHATEGCCGTYGTIKGDNGGSRSLELATVIGGVGRQQAFFLKV